MSDVESLVIAIAKARPDWSRADIRAGIADVVRLPLHKLSLNRAASPLELRAFVHRWLSDELTAAIASPAPPVDHVLDPEIPAAPPTTEYREARAQIAARRQP
jgi:hypothetical protein